MTDISTLGEFGLIEHLTKNINLKNSGSVFGIGDDAAVLNNQNGYSVITTDLLVEGIHFDLTYTPLKHLGYKAVAVNISDVCAMNAVPKQITVSIAVSAKFSVESLNELYDGIKTACEKYKVDLVGGDTTSSVTGMVISITAVGIASPEKIVYRNSAKLNDIICVSGDLGAAYAGLQLLEREKSVFNANPEIQPDLSNFDYILERQLKPEPRTDIIQLFDTLNIIPTSMIDISDGLSSELLHICKNSDCGCVIYEDKLPIADQTKSFAIEVLIDSTTFALNGGEDYELLFTVSQADYQKIAKSNLITPIGFIAEKQKSAVIIAKDGTEILLTAQGWNSLK